MGGEGAEVFLNGLVVADIRQHLLEERELGFGRGHGKAGLRHQAEQPDGLEGDGFAAGIGAADQQGAAVAGSSSRVMGTGGLAAAAQHVLQQRVARVLEAEALAEAGDGAIELGREPGLAEDQFELGHGDQGLADGIAVGAQAVGHLEQDAVDLAHLLFGEAHELVVEIDGFERLDEERVAAGAGGVDHAIDLAALSGDHRNHEALVADGDELLLQDALLAVGAQEALERFLNGLLLALDIAAQAMRARRWRDRPRCHRAGSCRRVRCSSARKSPMVSARRPSSGKRLGGGGQVRLGIGGDIQQREQLEDFLGLEAGAFDARVSARRARTSGRPPNSDADGGAAPGRIADAVATWRY